MKIPFRTIITSSLLLAMPLSAAAFRYKVSGNIQGIPDGSTVVLIPMTHMEVDPIAQTKVSGGKFELTGNSEEPMGVILMVEDSYGSTRFVVEEGDITISGTAQGAPQAGGKTSYSYNDIKIQGSPLTDKYNAIMQPRKDLDKIMTANQEKGYPLMTKYSEARKEGNQALMDSITSSYDYKEYTRIEKECFENFSKVLDEAITSNKDSFFGPLVMLSQLSYIPAEMKKYYDLFSETARNSYAGRQVAAELFPVGQLGEKTPDFSVPDINGNDLSLDNVCRKNKYILLDFWASWCRPCRKEIPNIKAIYDKHHANGLEILSVSIDTDEAAWRKAVAKEALPWKNVMDTDKNISKLYHVSAVPTMYLLDTEGRLVADRLSGEELAAKIDELLSE